MDLSIIALVLAVVNIICTIVFINAANKSPVINENAVQCRSMHELLKILRVDIELDEHYLYMTTNVRSLEKLGVITVIEALELKKYITGNAPKRMIPYAKAIYLKWLNEHIMNTANENR